MKFLPNILTILRLTFPIYVIIIIIFFNSLEVQCILILYIFIILSLTDYLDGYLARKFNSTSRFGKVFDPISDKILTTTTLLFLSSIEIKILIPSILISFREFFVTGVREYSLIKNNKNINVSYLSKVKTTLQFIILSFLLFLFSISDTNFFIEIVIREKLIEVSIYSLWLVVFLTLYTGFQYCYYVYLKNRKGKKL